MPRPSRRRFAGADATVVLDRCSAYVAEPLLFGLLVAKIVNLSLQHGRSAMTAFAHAVYGLFLTDAGEYQGLRVWSSGTAT